MVTASIKRVRGQAAVALLCQVARKWSERACSWKSQQELQPRELLQLHKTAANSYAESVGVGICVRGLWTSRPAGLTCSCDGFVVHDAYSLVYCLDTVQQHHPSASSSVAECSLHMSFTCDTYTTESFAAIPYVATLHRA
jgi:hypothetical protein